MKKGREREKEEEREKRGQGKQGKWRGKEGKLGGGKLKMEGEKVWKWAENLFFFFFLVTIWNHWNFFGVYQNGNLWWGDFLTSPTCDCKPGYAPARENDKERLVQAGADGCSCVMTSPQASNVQVFGYLTITAIFECKQNPKLLSFKPHARKIWRAGLSL